MFKDDIPGLSAFFFGAFQGFASVIRLLDKGGCPGIFFHLKNLHT
jgi:hypothetical protein